jgi:dTDP-4-dehydrorhamnose reductase
VRILITGGAGFVGSNLAAVSGERGHEVVCVVRSPPPWPDARASYTTLDLLDERAVLRSIREAQPDAIVHTAILNDFRRLYQDREHAWRSYIGVTRTLADAANEVGALLVYVSTDWVFDGTQANATEQTPPNPINLYGFLKAASELVVLERAHEATVARIAGVMGTHRARPEPPRTQDAGFGYFVAALADALARGEAFTVWEGEDINMYATPSLASHSAELIVLLAERRTTGVFHCCGREAVTRMELARAAAEVFGLDHGLLRSGAPDPAALLHAPIPYDTTLDARATESALGVRLPDVRELLSRFRSERQAAP